MLEILHKPDFDIGIVGSGIAGTVAAKSLSAEGYRVALIGKDYNHPPPNKSLFVNEDQLDPNLVSHLSQRGALFPTPHVQLINADNQTYNWARKMYRDGTTSALLHPAIINYYQNQTNGKIEVVSGIVSRSYENADKVKLTLDDRRDITCSYLVDASGDYSSVTRQHYIENKGKMLNDDPVGLWIRGYKVYGEFTPGTLIDPIGEKIGLSWVLPYTADYGDIIAANFCRLSQLNPKTQKETLSNLINFCQEQQLCTVKQIEEPLIGFIRCEPIKKETAGVTKRVFPLGSSAGMGSPLMAEVVPAAIHWAEYLSKAISNHLTPAQFYDIWRRKEAMFPYDVEMAMLSRRMEKQKKGIYGSNTPIYQTIINQLPFEAQREVLMNHRIPVKYWSKIIFAVLESRELIPYLADFSVHFTRVKIREGI